MSREIKITSSMKLTGTAGVNLNSPRSFFDSQSVNEKATLAFNLTDTAQNLSFPSLTTPRWAELFNTSTPAASNYDAVLGVDAGGFQEVLRIPPGKANIIRIGNSVTLQGKCDSGESNKLEVTVLDG